MTWPAALRVNPSILMALGLMAVVIMMILPVPSWILDVGLAASFGLAILVFTIALFAEKPLDFSAFPTVLLATLMLRLSLNVSSTKLIIGEGHTGTDAAGKVIEGFANFIMGGNVFLGVVVFGVLMIVNFVVITKGATRMAEVGARFALDGMPGKQLAIDSDLSSGAISHADAKQRREVEQQETTFFGSLDGASKFVRGDAVAGLLITLLNITVGLGMGVLAHGMPLGQAFETYAILTVGDGLVSQIPSVIISFASALLLSRGGTKGAMDMAMLGQLGRNPNALVTVAGLMVLFALVPGMPFVPFILAGAGLGTAAYVLAKRKSQTPDDTPEAEHPAAPTMGDVLDLDDVHVAFAPDLVAMILDPATGIDARITGMRRHIAERYGFIMPEIRLTDDDVLGLGEYVVRIHGVETARGVLHPDMVLALLRDGTEGLPDGHDVREPVYGAPARWIRRKDQEKAVMRGATIVAPAEVLATHMLEITKRSFPRLLTMKALRRIIDEMKSLSNSDRAEANRRLLDEIIPDRVSLETLHMVLRLLLAEQVSIRNLPLILESLSEAKGLGDSAETLCEFVRQRLGHQIIAGLKRSDGTVPMLQLAPEWERTFLEHQTDSTRGGHDLALPPDIFERLATSIADQVTRTAEKGLFPALVAPARRRRFLSTIVSLKGMSMPVISFEELSHDTRPALVGIVAA